eukprot:TRINITY_DN277_c1_g1_i4.p2 TRINITY_DN277_c1_g1~~TRINITY_DN277_c1_g1_i4.p2  ORF type:complete len:178 (+),score=53.35 TRINITY_DN277_c1_g1_i4:99-632(+)
MRSRSCALRVLGLLLVPLALCDAAASTTTTSSAAGAAPNFTISPTLPQPPPNLDQLTDKPTPRPTPRPTAAAAAPTAPPTQEVKSSGGGGSNGATIGIAVGVSLAAIALLGAGGLLYRKSRAGGGAADKGVPDPVDQLEMGPRDRPVERPGPVRAPGMSRARSNFPQGGGAPRSTVN